MDFDTLFRKGDAEHAENPMSVVDRVISQVEEEFKDLPPPEEQERQGEEEELGQKIKNCNLKNSCLRQINTQRSEKRLGTRLNCANFASEK